MKTIIALDAGTMSMRAVVFTLDGKVLYQSGREYHTIFPKPSWVEQEPETWKCSAWETLKDAGEFLRKENHEALAVSVTSQRASMIPMDADDRPLYNAIMWQDKRTVGICNQLIETHGLGYFYRKTGLRVNPFFVLNKIIWLRQNMPEVFGKVKKFVGVQDYIVYQLTHQYKTDWTQASRTMLMNLSTFKWDEELLSMAQISQDQLCELIPPGGIAAGLCEECAAQTGLPQGLPVVISGGDQQNAAIALGVVKEGMAEANSGTGSFVLSYSEKPVFEPKARVLCQASAIAGKWMAETSIFNTGAIFRWLKERSYSELLQSDSPYPIMCAEAAQSPLGSRGVVMIPHFEGSAAPYWNPKAKGMFFNLGLASTRGDLTRAVLEGVAMEIAANLQLMREMIGDINTVSVAGGMTRGDLFCQIHADACNARIRRTANAEATALGAMINAAVTLKVYDSHTQALEKLQIPEECFEPVPEHAKAYAKLIDRKETLYRVLNEGGVYDLFFDM